MSGHVLILLENEPYPYDARVRQEAAALANHGYEVTVAAPTGFGYDEPEEMLDGVRVLRYRAPPPGRGPAGYAREYALSLLRLAALTRRVRREKPVDAVMVVAAPDLIVLPALPLAVRGTGLVLDHHDPSPELFERKFHRRGLLWRILLAVERMALGRCDVVLAVNDSCAGLVRRRGGLPPERVFVVRQGPDPARIFAVEPCPELRRGRQHLVLWVGTVSAAERVAGVVELAAELVQRRGRADVTFAVVGPGEALEDVREDVRNRGLEQSLELPGPVGNDLLRGYLATADVCVSVDRSNPMNDISTVTKVLDYMAVGRAVVQYPLPEMELLCAGCTQFVPEGDIAALADRVEALLADPAQRERLGRAARERVLDGLAWPDQVPQLLEAVSAAIARGRARR